MKVYIVYNEALHHDSSYHGIVDVFANLEDAQACVGCESHDFCLGIDRGDFGNDFDEIEIDEDAFPIDTRQWDEWIVSTKGYYEAWRIEEREVL